MIEILGYAAATLTTVSFVPQAIKTLRSGDTAAISLRMYLLFTSGIAL
ncbi:MAG: SemiSWEET family sugar transporter, partial [Cyanobium sp.]